MKFKDYPLSDGLKNQLAEIGFNRPTDIQFKVIPHVLNGENVFAVAQTGTGKTAAFAIPVLQQIENWKTKGVKGIKCLVMVPTRELCRQIAAHISNIGKQTSVHVFGLHGGEEQDAAFKKALNKLDILVTTPGRMFDLEHQGIISLNHVKILVLDEADLMLDLGFRKDIFAVCSKFKKTPQTLFFTATINRKIKTVAYEVVNNPIRIQLSPKNPVAKTIDHSVLFVEMDDKRFFLENMIQNDLEKRILVFVRTKVRADRVQQAMIRVGIESSCLHGGMEQEDRFKILDDFKIGTSKVLITTDLSARGIDIPSVDVVVNYDMPEHPETYVHRCGRTGRGNKRGNAISLCSPGEIPLLKEIEAYTGQEIERFELSGREYSDIVFDSEDPHYDWQKLIQQANEEEGTKDTW
jgi:ATP-dependent RNA helicase RhlE